MGVAELVRALPQALAEGCKKAADDGRLFIVFLVGLDHVDGHDDIDSVLAWLPSLQSLPQNFRLVLTVTPGAEAYQLITSDFVELRIQPFACDERADIIEQALVTKGHNIEPVLLDRLLQVTDGERETRWLCLHDPSTKQQYYVDQYTGKTSWKIPTDAKEGDTIEDRWVRTSPPGGAKSYYFDIVSGQTAWQLPALSKADKEKNRQNTPQFRIQGAPHSKVNGLYREKDTGGALIYVHTKLKTIQVRRVRAKACWVISENFESELSVQQKKAVLLYQSTVNTLLPPLHGWELVTDESVNPGDMWSPQPFKVEYLEPHFWQPHFFTLQAMVLLRTLPTEPALSRTVMQSTTMAELIEVELIRLENEFDSGLDRPIWACLSQMAFAPCGLAADELCIVANITAGDASLAWAVLSQALDCLLLERRGVFQFRSPAVATAVRQRYLKAGPQLWAIASLQLDLISRLNHMRTRDLFQDHERFSAAGVYGPDEELAKELPFAEQGLTAHDLMFLSIGIGCGETALETIDLTKNTISDAGAAFLGGVLKKNDTVARLLIASNDIGSDGAIRLFTCIAMNPSSKITFIDLVGNKIKCEGAKALAEALESGSCIDVLDLRENKIGAAGSKALADALMQPSTGLTILRMNNNLVRDRGAMALGSALEKNKKLVELTLASNQIKDDGAKAIGLGLIGNSTLKKLILRCNKVGAIGGAGLADGLTQNKALEEIDLSKNTLLDDGLCSLARAMMSNRFLKQMDVSVPCFMDPHLPASSRTCKAVHPSALMRVLLYYFSRTVCPPPIKPDYPSGSLPADLYKTQCEARLTKRN